MSSSKLAGLIGALFLSACAADVAPTARVLGTLDLKEAPVLFVTANRDRERVAESLTDAGFSVTEEVRKANLVLEAKLGSKRGDGPCGVVRNVIYVLLERGAPVIQLKGRGGTGWCPNSILDQLSHELARSLEVPGSDRKPL